MYSKIKCVQKNQFEYTFLMLVLYSYLSKNYQYFNILISIAKKPIIENSIRISLKETRTLLDQQCLCYEHRGEEAPQGSGFRQLPIGLSLNSTVV